MYNDYVRINMEKMPKSVRKTYEAILSGNYTTADIVRATKLSNRTIRYAIKKLLEMRLIRKIPNLHDMRRSLYVPAKR